MPTDFLTLLRPLDNPCAGKQITASGPVTPAPATYWRGGQVALDSPERLFVVLERAAQAREWIAVRGAIRPGVNRERMARRHVVDHDPTLEPAGHSWLMLDLDKYQPDTDMREHPAEYYARAARSALPAPFQGAACWYQATSSARIKPGVRLRLAFWLAAPISDDQAKQLVSTWDVPVDTSLFTPSQPHFLAAPEFVGVPDPYEGESRSGTLDGSPTVALGDPLARSAAEDALAREVRKMRKAEQGERRNVLNTCAYRLAAQFPEDELPAERIRGALEQALLASGGTSDYKAALTLAQAIQDGRAKHARDRQGWRGQLALDEAGQPRSTAANTSLYLEHHSTFAGRLAYDERAGRHVWLEPPPWPDRGALADTTQAIEWFQTQAHMDVKPGWVRDGLLKASLARRFDPVQDWLNALPAWDATPRLDTFLCRHLGVADTPLHRAQTRAWFIQAARRAFATSEQPVQADYLLVLCGEQGQRKSSLFRALCPLPRFFRDSLPPLGDPDASAAMINSWIVELSELTQRKADQDQFKAFISRQVEQFRRKYRPDEELAPRRCVLLATTNTRTPLSDPTGNRRFWCMTVTRRAELDEVLAEREQLWAEALHRARAGERAYLTGELELAAREQADTFAEEDPTELRLERVLAQPVTGFEAQTWQPGQLSADKRVRWLTALQAGELVREDKDMRAIARVKRALERLGWRETRVRGKRVWQREQEPEHGHAAAN